MNNFSTRFRLTTLKSQDTINIKQLVYRSTTIFIAALARKHNISANSCFDIINEMAKNKQITQNTAEKLRCAIAIACEMRLRVYIDKQSQCDNAIDLKQDGIKKFLDIVGVACTINYFQIAYCLQCEVAKQLNFTKLHFYTDSQLINVTIALAFGRKNLVNFSKDSQRRLWDPRTFNFDNCIKQLETNLSYDAINEEATSSTNLSQLDEDQLECIADHLVSAEIFDEALDFYHQLLNYYIPDIFPTDGKQNHISYDYKVAQLGYQIGCCLHQLNREAEALIYYFQALAIFEDIIQNHKTSKTIAEILHKVGCCQNELHHYDDAKANLKRALEIHQNRSIADNDGDIAATLHSIGCNYFGSNNFQEALFVLNQALEINLKTGNQTSIATTRHVIGQCHIHLHNYNTALTNLLDALEIEEVTTINAEIDSRIAVKLKDIGDCYIVLHDYDKALEKLDRAFRIYKNKTLNVESDRDIAATLHNIGRCQINLKNYNQALTNLQQVHQIYEKISHDHSKDRDLASTKLNIGRCLIGLQQYDEAKESLNTSLKIAQSATKNKDKDIKIAKIFHYKGENLIAQQRYEEAVECLQKARKIYEVQTNAEKDTKLGATLHCVGFSCLKLQKHAEGLNYLKNSLDIYQRFNFNYHYPPNKTINSKIESIRLKINDFLSKLS